MDAKPEGQKGTQLTRRDMQSSPEMPEIYYGAHLINSLSLLKDVTYQEIIVWANSFKPRFKIKRWEAEAMVRLMKSYESMSRKAVKKTCPPPYMTNEGGMAQFDSQWAAMKASVPTAMMGMPMTGAVDG